MPRHYVEYGKYWFDDDAISSGSCRLVISPIANSLEVNTFKSTVLSGDNLEEDFKRNTKLVYKFNGDVFGVFYIQKIKQKTSIAYDITATSVLGILSESNHYGGIYEGVLAKDLISDICGSVPHSIKTSLQNIKLYGYLPIATRRDNLVQVLMAIGGVIKTDRLGVIQITGLYDHPTGAVDEDHLFVNSVPKIDTKVTDLVVMEHQYLKVATEEKVLFDGNAFEGDIITFDNPVYDIVARGFSIIESGANYAKVTAGTGQVVGKEYQHNVKEVSRHLADAEFPNVKKVENATLVSLVNSRSVADNIASYLSRSYFEITSDAKHTGYFPGDIVSTLNPRNMQRIDAFVSEAEMHFGSFMRCKGTWIKGYVPHKAGADQFLDERVLITENMKWIVPDGVTSIRAIIIGGGDGGRNGARGMNGASGGNGYAGSSGQSGEPGDGGLGGKIYEIQIDVVGGQEFQVNIGLGGDPNSAGSPTTFGEYSSDSGERSSYGYIDVTTGEVFGNQGIGGSKIDPVDTPKDIGKYTMQSSYQPTAGGGLVQKDTLTCSERSEIRLQTELLERVSNGNNKYTVYYKLMVSGRALPNGITPGKANDATNYGGGGNGGHGGQGGKGGPGYAVLDIPEFWYLGGNFKISFRDNELEATTGSSGGSGGEAGAGKSGCVLLFYSKPKKIQSGYIKDTKGRIMLDSTRKLIVV